MASPSMAAAGSSNQAMTAARTKHGPGKASMISQVQGEEQDVLTAGMKMPPNMQFNL
jgi:hypothetical protein